MTIPISETEINGHRYGTVPYGFDQAFNIGLELAELIGGPLGDAFRAVMSGDQSSLELEDALGELGPLGMSLPKLIRERGGSEMFDRVLCRTYQVSELVTESPTSGRRKTKQIKLSLDSEENRDRAFGGGLGLAEGLKVMGWVLKVNFGPFLTDLWSPLSTRLPELMSSWSDTISSVGLGSELSEEQESEPESATASSMKKPSAGP